MCTNLSGGAPWHRHFHLIGGGIDFSARYPPRLVAGVLKAVRDQLRQDGHLSALESSIAGPIAEEPEVPHEWRELLLQGGGFWDDVHGGWLPDKMVIAARAEELRWVHEQEVYKIVPRSTAEAAGHKPLSLLWVDTNKSLEETKWQIRSRLCVREYKMKKAGNVVRAMPAAQLFSAMPPIEAMRTLCSLLVTWRNSNSGGHLSSDITT